VEEVDEGAITEMQEGLIEVDVAPEEQEELLDEFEKRLRSLRDRRKDRGG
jgi:signal recognition particle GTPase